MSKSFLAHKKDRRMAKFGLQAIVYQPLAYDIERLLRYFPFILGDGVSQ